LFYREVTPPVTGKNIAGGNIIIFWNLLSEVTNESYADKLHPMLQGKIMLAVIISILKISIACFEHELRRPVTPPVTG